jgi:hypothetical protein
LYRLSGLDVGFGVAMVCNIDRRGRSVRYRIASVLVPLGVVLWLVTSRFLDGVWPWLLGGVLLAGGLFSWFEASRGWCAVRALGFKTRL